MINLILENPYLQLFIVSTLPIVELRGAMIVAAAQQLPFLNSLLVCILGNMLPIPFILLFAKRVLVWLSGVPKIGRFFQKIIDKADEKARKFGKVELLALYLFVALPLPGTGAWMGSLVSTILRIRFLPSILAIFLGVITSGIIMGVISFGVGGLLEVIFFA